MLDYDKLAECLKTELPLNRKERFYTGTVLPSILFHNGTGNLFRFLREIDGFPPEVDEASTVDDFLFYTEYNLKQSAGKKNIGATINTDSNDTPDAVIEVLAPLKAFVVIEAKMFSNISETAFGGQIKAQKRAFNDAVQAKYGLDNGQMFHVALVPEKLGLKSTPDYQVIHWEFLHSDAMDLDGNYFVNYLRIALKNYSDLVSSSPWGEPSTATGQMKGFDIYNDHTAGEEHWVGRCGGKVKIGEDIRKGSWRNFNYYISPHKPEGGRKGNWIHSSVFADLVDGIDAGE
ncbi:MAG: hypothetical protein ACYC4M_04365 [Thermoleophilia bacterium]